MNNFWSTLDTLSFGNEASVEIGFILPFLEVLGYDQSDISPKHSVIFQEGRLGRKPEADFIIFYGPTHSKDTSLIAIEVKKPGEKLESAKLQCESYASNMRTPFMIVTDGVNIEIWQIQLSTESTLLLKSSVRELAESRGKIESCISKGSAYEYAKKLTFKSALNTYLDFELYENSVIKRCTKYKYTIERTLFVADESIKQPIKSTDLLALYPNGAIVLASSGYGKTTVLFHLLLIATELRKENSNLRLSLDIYLPDLAISQSTILDFTLSRLQAYQTTFTNASLKKLMQTDGFLFLCDGFDRISEHDQKRFEVEIINIQRDYSLSQFFIFSRAIATPRLDLPTLTLELLSIEEQMEFTKSILKYKGLTNRSFYGDEQVISIDSLLSDIGMDSTPSIIQSIPILLRDFCSYPLLLELIINYWLLNKTYPTNIESIFKNWFNATLLINQNNTVEELVREEAIKLIANNTVNSPSTKSKIISLFREHGIPITILSDLIRMDSISIQGDSLEVKHEGLADYLRICSLISSQSSEALESTLESIPLRPDSLFPILLVAMLPTYKLQKKLWVRLAHSNVNLYINALRFRADHSKEIINSPNNALFFLEEIIDGLELPLQGFVPQIERNIVESLTRNVANEITLAISGTLSTSQEFVNYSFHTKADNQSRVNLSEASQKNYIDLELMNYRLDSGRTIGSAHLFKTILKVISERKIIGDVTWCMERLVSRLRIINNPQLDIQPFHKLDHLEELLLPYINLIVYSESNGGSYFTVHELISDITELKRNGINALDSWWLRLGYSHDLSIKNKKQISDLICEHYRRTQILYKELIENSFSEIREMFGLYIALPIRWDIYITEVKGIGIFEHYSWLPVLSWEDAGANVYFTAQPNKDPIEKHNELRSMLKSFGREKANALITGGFSPFPNFDGNNIIGKYDGETPSLRRACELIESDISRIFGELEHIK